VRRWSKVLSLEFVSIEEARGVMTMGLNGWRHGAAVAGREEAEVVKFFP